MPVQPSGVAASQFTDISPPPRTLAQRKLPTPEALNLWMSAVAQGDRKAFADLFMHFAPRVKGYLMRSGTQEPVADDLAQETMLTVWRRAASFDPDRGALATWVFAIARNLRTDHHRRATARGEGGMVFVDFELLEEGCGGADARSGPDEALLTVQRERSVRRALASLAAEQALILRLFFFEEQSHSTIARELAMPLGSVKTRIRTAVAQMRKLLQREQ
jgi:RNA polymerase sigma-70 factor (ECF subfamily)